MTPSSTRGAVQVILHIPHASTAIPVLDGFVGDWRAEIDLLTDWATDELFDLPGALRIEADFSRVMCDVERFADDAQEPMAASGMGFAYTTCDDGRPLRVVDAALRERLLRDYYQPHHQRLERAVQTSLAAGREVVLIDCHSFSDVPFQRDRDQRRPRPDICLGTDPVWSEAAAVARMLDLCATRGLSVTRDQPYAGTMVPTCLNDYAPLCRPRFWSYMIEINRRLYLEGTRPVAAKVAALRLVVEDLIAAALPGPGG